MAAPQEPWWLPHGTPGLVSVGGNQGWGRNSLAPVQRRSGGFRGGGSGSPECPSRGLSCSGGCSVLLCLGQALTIRKRNPLMPASTRVRGGGPRWRRGHRESVLGPQDREGGQGSYQLDSSPGTGVKNSCGRPPSSSSSSSSQGGRRPLHGPSPLPRSHNQRGGRLPGFPAGPASGTRSTAGIPRRPTGAWENVLLSVL